MFSNSRIPAYPCSQGYAELVALRRAWADHGWPTLLSGTIFWQQVPKPQVPKPQVEQPLAGQLPVGQLLVGWLLAWLPRERLPVAAPLNPSRLGSP